MSLLGNYETASVYYQGVIQQIHRLLSTIDDRKYSTFSKIGIQFLNILTIDYRIVVYIRFGFFGKFFLPICLIKVYTFISSDIFLPLYVYFSLYVLVKLDYHILAVIIY